MNATVKQAPPGQKGFDADTPLSADQAAQFKANGYNFCVRYLSLHDVEGGTELTPTEIAAIMDAGLALMAVQHVRESPWSPSAANGTADGQNAVEQAEQLNLLKGMNIWLDLEGIAPGTSADVVVAHCQNWYQAVNRAGYVPGLYVGANSILNGAELYSLLSFQHYWKSLSRVPEVAQRGYQMIQSAGREIAGISFDEDVTQNDQLGGTVLWMVNA